MAKKILVFEYVPDLLTTEGNIEKFLKNVVEVAGPANVVLRFFLMWIWGSGRNFMPFMQAMTKSGELIWFTHPNTGKKYTVYDQRKPNPEYFEKLKLVDSLLKKNRIYACPSLMDYRNPSKETKYFYPFKCSLQSLSIENVPYVTPKEARKLCAKNIGGIYGDLLRFWHHTWHEQIIPAMTANLFAEVANEFSTLNYETPDEPLAWHKWSADDVDDLMPKRNRVVISGYTDREMKQKYHYSYHGIGDQKSYNSQRERFVGRAIVSADGFFAGSGSADAKGKKGSSVSEASAVAILAKNDELYGVEIMCRALWRKNNEKADLKLYKPEVLVAVSKILFQ